MHRSRFVRFSASNAEPQLRFDGRTVTVHSRAPQCRRRRLSRQPLATVGELVPSALDITRLRNSGVAVATAAVGRLLQRRIQTRVNTS